MNARRCNTVLCSYACLTELFFSHLTWLVGWFVGYLTNSGIRILSLLLARVFCSFLKVSVKIIKSKKEQFCIDSGF